MKQNPLNKFKVSLNSIHNATWNDVYMVIYNGHHKSSFGRFGSSSPTSTCKSTVSKKQSFLLTVIISNFRTNFVF